MSPSWRATAKSRASWVQRRRQVDQPAHALRRADARQRQARIDGIDIRGETSKARAHLGVLAARRRFVRQSDGPREHRLLRLTAEAWREACARTAELARALGMEAFIDRRAKGFSQGQRIKVALARALVHDPGNLVLDEPTNGLDVMAIRNLRDMLLTLKAQGRCILFSSHVMQEVAALCDRVVIIGHGRVLADATVQTIRETQRRGDAWKKLFCKYWGCRGVS
jgi:sodium transport system ATP-binding protein